MFSACACRNHFHPDCTCPAVALAAQKGSVETSTPPAMKAKSVCDEGGSESSVRNEVVRANMRKLLAELRSGHTVDVVREHYSSSMPSYTVFENATGGCLDTIAAGIAGFRHLGGTEDIKTALGKTKAKMFEYVSGAKCKGDSREWQKWVNSITEVVDYWKSGMPCTNYAALGDKLGHLGNKGGDLYLLQLDQIKHIRPYVVRLEQVPSALDIEHNGIAGWAVKYVIDSLSEHYKVYAKVVSCWKHGDPSARKRLVIIGMLKSHFKNIEWEWPDEIFSSDIYPIARDVAVPDSDVPVEYMRDDPPSVTYKNPKIPKAGSMQRLAYHGNPNLPETAGSSSKPNSTQGWDGAWSTQMSTNGGSRRPLLSWEPGTPIGATRLTVPKESCMLQSLDDKSYMALARMFYKKSLGISYDQFVRELVNLGFPLCTGIAIDLKVREKLKQANTELKDHCTSMDNIDAIDYSNSCGSGCLCKHTPCSTLPDRVDESLTPNDYDHIYLSNRAELGWTGESPNLPAFCNVNMGIADSGATDFLHDSQVNPYLRDARPSGQRYQTAGTGSIYGNLEGELDVTV